MSAAFRQSPEPIAFTHYHRDGGVTIRVIGVGGAGGNAVSRMLEDEIRGVEFLIANTDAQALTVSPIPRKLRLGEALTRGLGAGGDPEIGSRAARESIEELRSVLRASDLVFITSGMGGGTGTGASPIIARLAKELGALVVAVVTMPFRFEGARRMRQAMRGIEELRPFVDTLIVVPNERLLSIVEHHQAFTEALHTGDEILRQAVRGISDLITTPGLINLDFADVRSIITGAGTALMAIGEATGDRRAMEATQRAVESPLLESDIRGARRILLNVTGGADLTLFEINEIATTIQSLAHPDATIIFGTVLDDSMQGMLRVTLIAAAYEYDETERRPVTHIHEERSTERNRVISHVHTTLRPRADVQPPDSQFGDAWPLSEDAALLIDEPTMALPALSPVTRSGDTKSQDPADSGISRNGKPLRDETQPRIEAERPREVRIIETQWKTNDASAPDDSLDIPAFLRRK